MYAFPYVLLYKRSLLFLDLDNDALINERSNFEDVGFCITTLLHQKICLKNMSLVKNHNDHVSADLMSNRLLKDLAINMRLCS